MYIRRMEDRMNYFLKKENVEVYEQMMQEYDNTFIIQEIENIVPDNATILELGMGTGADLIALAEKYQVLGSDYSPIFIDKFKEKYDLNVCVLDAVTVEIRETFDCIFSNKVLQHLTVEEFIESLNNQGDHLNFDGVLIFTLWKGEHKESLMFDGDLRFIYYNEMVLNQIIPEQFQVQEMKTYTEMESDDSLFVVLRLSPE